MIFYISTNDEVLDRAVLALAEGLGFSSALCDEIDCGGEDTCAIVDDASRAGNAQYALVISDMENAPRRENNVCFVPRPVDISALSSLFCERSGGRKQSTDAVVWNKGTRTVALGGKSAVLTPREAELFELLYRAGGAPVSKDEILSAFGGKDSNLPTVYICYLRRRLEPVLGKGALTSVRGGYLLKL